MAMAISTQLSVLFGQTNSPKPKDISLPSGLRGTNLKNSQTQKPNTNKCVVLWLERFSDDRLIDSLTKSL